MHTEDKPIGSAHRRGSPLLTLLTSIALTILVGCASAPPRVEVDLPPVPEVEDMKLKAGDTLDIEFLHTPELDSTQNVRADGKISLLHVGEIDVSDMTAAQLNQHLVKAYGDYLQDPVINVILRARPFKQIYVGGEVRNPGILTLVPSGQATGDYASSSRVIHQARLTLTEAIMAVGGYNNQTSKRSNVIVIRHIDGERYAKSFDLSAATMPGRGEAVYLAPHDIVYVSRTRIDKVDQWIDQHINRVIPSTTVYWARQSGNSSYGVAP